MRAFCVTSNCRYCFGDVGIVPLTVGCLVVETNDTVKHSQQPHCHCHCHCHCLQLEHGERTAATMNDVSIQQRVETTERIGQRAVVSVLSPVLLNGCTGTRAIMC